MITVTFFFRSLALLIAGLLLACCLFIFGLDYDTLTATLFGSYDQPEKLVKFRTQLLTPERFRVLRFLLLGITLAVTGLVIYTWNRAPQLAAGLQKAGQHGRQLCRSVQALWQTTSRIEKIAVLAWWIAIWLAQWWLAFQLPFHIDERFTYLYFVSKGWGVSLAYYPNPNNHILFTLLCNVLDSLLRSPFVVMKVAALLVGGILPVVFWLVMRVQFKATVAWLTMALFTSSGYVFYYATQGRGYSLLMLFVLIATHSALQLVRSSTIRRAWYGWFIISCALGFYTIPIFLYPFSGIALYTTIALLYGRHYQKLFLFLFACVAAAGATLLLYLPVFLLNGWSAVSGNSWVAPQPWAAFWEVLPAHIAELAGAIWWYEDPRMLWLTVITILFCLLLIWRGKEPCANRQWAGLLLACLVTLPVILIGQRILLYHRVLTYMAVFLYPVAAIGLVAIINRISRTHLVRRLLMLLIGGTVYAMALYPFTGPRSFNIYDSFDGVAAVLYTQKADSIFVQYYEYSLCIRFQYETNGRKIYLDTNTPQTGFPYHYVVVHRDHAFPVTLSRKTYQPIYRDSEATVYRRVRREWANSAN